ncbi:MAG TPA: hypothetical protein VN610_04200 [Bryobacteraceae bacterium]|nr:hypothetical protein [Bryobacteraceae bacterium]
MPDDPLNKALHHTIRAAWSSADAMMRFKSLDNEMVELGMTLDGKPLSQKLAYLKEAPMGCGDSAPRLCEILIGDGLRETPSSGIDLTDNARMKEAFLAMQKTVPYFLVRIDVIGKGVGHAYVFVSGQRKSAKSPLDGYIYQTNVGPEAENRFDLIEWVNDKKSEEKVFLPGYLLEIQAQLAGYLMNGSGERTEFTTRAAKIYEQNYLLSGKELSESDAAKANAAPTAAGGVKVKILARPINEVAALDNLKKLADG